MWLLTAALIGCQSDEAADGPDDDFLVGGKADGIEEGSRDARAVLHVANSESAEILDAADGVGLDTRAVTEILAFRRGEDEVAGTPDDRELSTLAELDDILFVGPVAFRKLLAHAARVHACGLEMQAEATLAITEQGAARGGETGGTLTFKNLPFARPPTGNRRWRAPDPPTCWAGERPASEFGDICLQYSRATQSAIGAEDCLSLNVWTPSGASSGLRPVMVFIHGGGNMGGSAIDGFGTGIQLYDGQELATRGNIVVVTLQYRLNIVGFFKHAALSTESPHHASGNYGLQDQIAALQWVQQNIATFGGDPDRVLLSGESGGGTDVCALVGSPLAVGLFSSALVESGHCNAATSAAVESWSDSFVTRAGCAGASDVLACVRALDPAKMIASIDAASVDGFGRSALPAGPTVDGHVLPVGADEAFRNGSHNHVPLVLGVNAEETAAPLFGIPLFLSSADYESRVRALFSPAKAESVLAAYPVTSFPTPRAALVALTTDHEYICPARIWARDAAANQEESVYRYLYTHALQGGLGATHGSELLFVFQAVRRLPGYTPSQQDLELEDAIRGYWTRLAASGKPDGGGAVAWPPYDRTADTYLDLGSPVVPGAGIRTDRCAFWESIGF